MEFTCTILWSRPPLNTSFNTDNDLNLRNTSGISTYSNNDTVSSQDSYVLSVDEKIEAIIYTRVILAVAIFGFFGNILNLAILTRKAFMGSMERMEVSAQIGLISLAVSDCLFCLLIIPKCFIHQSNFSFHKYVGFYVIYQVYGDAIINIFQMSSTWLTVTIAVSRYLAVCHPFKARMFIGRTSAKLSVTIAYFTAFIFNIPRFWEHTIETMPCREGYNAYYVIPGFLRMNKHSRHIYLWFYFVLNIFIPIMVLAFCNINLVKTVRGLNANNPSRNFKSVKEKQRSGETLTLTLLLIIVFYILLVTPAELTNFILLIVEFEPKQLTGGFNLTLAVLSTFLTLNFSINFILYCSVHSRFRQVMKQTICLGNSRYSFMTPPHSAGLGNGHFDTGMTGTGEARQMSLIVTNKGQANCYVTNSG